MNTKQVKHKKQRPVRLQVQFQVALGMIFLLFCGLIAWLIYVHEKQTIEEAALSKSRIVLAAVASTQTYIRNVLRPKMYALNGPDTFIMEAMSASYVSRAVMDRFHESMPTYRYRRVAVKARNPVSEPTAAELKMIEYFRSHPGATHWQGIREIDGIAGFLDVRPVRMTASCLKCHGTPKDAPHQLIEIYGSERGFGYRANQIAGITAVSIPVANALAKTRSKAFSVFCVTLGLMIFMYIVISFLFNRIVVRSLKDLLDIFQQGLVEDDSKIALLPDDSPKNEIHELSDAARKLTDHLQQARQDLLRHAENLENRVTERTQALENSRVHLKEKIAARNKELQTLNQIAELTTRSMRLADILPGVLEQTLGLIPAKGAAIYLFTNDQTAPLLMLEYERNADKLSHIIDRNHIPQSDSVPASLKESIWTAAGGKMSRFSCLKNENCLNVPLVCREKVLGVMTFVGINFGDTSSEMQSLLLSIGQQIGIAIDSLNNFSALLQSKDLLQSVFDGIPDMMVLLSPNLDIRMANRAYLNHHGVSLDEALKLKCRALEGTCDCPFADGSDLKKTFDSGRPTQGEVTMENGSIFMVSYYPIFNEGGELWGILRYAKDITLEKQVEQRIQQTEKMAAIGQLAAGVAHEINNPMGIILCYANLLKRQSGDNTQIVKDVEIIEKQADNCRRIIADLLNFSRSKKTQPQPADVNSAITDVVEMVRQQFMKKGIEIHMDRAAGLPVIMMDIDKIKQVLLNLLMNAGQAIRQPPGRIRIKTRFAPTPPSIEIVIRDNGMGIAKEILGHIFDPFFSTKQTGEGTGLGLSVSYGIIKDHGGDLHVKTETGQWTEFTIQLPAQESDFIKNDTGKIINH